MRYSILLQHISNCNECILIIQKNVVITDKNTYVYNRGRWFNRKEF